MQYPTLSTSTVRHLEVIALTPARLLMVVITDTGRVDQRVVELGDVIDDHQLSQLREMLGQALDGKKLSAASVAVADLAAQLDGRSGQSKSLSDAVGRSATVLLETLVEHTEERLLLGGTANLTRNTADFGGSLRSILEALEEQVVVLRLLAAQQEAGKVTVRIGHETEAEQMVGTSVVTTTYGSSAPSTAAWVCSGPPGWTIRELSLVSLRLLCTSAKCWVRDEPAFQAQFIDGRHGTADLGLRARKVQEGQAWHATITVCSAWARTRAMRRSSARIASWRANCIPTSTPTRRAQAKFKEISVAYEVLSDPEKRRIVDLGGDPLENAAAGGGGFGGFGGLGDVFEAFFGGGSTLARAGRTGPAGLGLAAADAAGPDRMRDRRQQAGHRRHRGAVRPMPGPGHQRQLDAGGLRHLRRSRRGADRAALVARPGA